MNWTEDEYAEFKKGRIERRLTKKSSSLPSARMSHTLRKDNSKAEICLDSIQAIPNLSAGSKDFLFAVPIRLRITVTGRTNADGDNIFKGVADSLEGLCFENDKYIKDGSFLLHDRGN